MLDLHFVTISKILLITTGITDPKIADPLELESKQELKEHLKKIKSYIKSGMFKAKIKILSSFPNSPEAYQLKLYINTVFQYEMAELITDTRNIDFLLNSDKLLKYFEQKINSNWFHIDGELIKQKMLAEIKENILASIIKIKTLMQIQIPEIERQITVHKKLMVNLNEATIIYHTLQNTILELEHQKTQVFFTIFFQNRNYKPKVINLNNIRQLNEAINKLSSKIQESIQNKLPIELIDTQKETRNNMLKNYLMHHIYEKEKSKILKNHIYEKEKSNETMSNLFLISVTQSKNLIYDINRDSDFKGYIIQALNDLNIIVPACLEDKKIPENAKNSAFLASKIAKAAARDAIKANINARNIASNLRSFERCSAPPPLPPRPAPTHF